MYPILMGGGAGQGKVNGGGKTFGWDTGGGGRLILDNACWNYTFKVTDLVLKGEANF